MIIWKGINFKDKGIIVEKIPNIIKGKKKINTISVEGRSGFITQDTGTYESFNLSLECHFDNNKYNPDDIFSFLDGYGKLSLDGIREYTAIIQNSISLEKVLRFRKFIIQFLVNPISEEINENNVNIETTPYSLNIEKATAEMYPILEITGTGNIQITFNNKTFHLLDINGTYILDCKEKVITKDNINASNKMLYDFPTLKPGQNEISYIGNITNFKIKYKRSFL